MKAKGSTLKRRVVTVVSALVSMLIISGSITAFARPLDRDGLSGPVPAAHPISAGAVGGDNFWIITLIVVAGVVALSAASIGTVRIYRSRARAVAAGV
jgi:hypothetical protein